MNKQKLRETLNSNGKHSSKNIEESPNESSQIDDATVEAEEDDDDDEMSVSSYATATTNVTSRSGTPSSKRARGRTRKIPKVPKSVKPTYKFSSFIKEDHNQPLFGAQFNTSMDILQPDVFAVVGTNRASIYKCLNNGEMELLQCYADPDPTEVYYTCAWSYETETGRPILAIAGFRAIIRIIHPYNQSSPKHYIGHGHAINEIRFHPREHQLLLSGSKDHSLRLWNINTGVCVAVFGGVEGHRDEVLSCDFDTEGNNIISCGMDHSLKMWRLDELPMRETIKNSYKYNEKKASRPFQTLQEHFPHFSTRDIHRNYVDCARWMGKFLLSKSCENSIICWKPGKFDDGEVKQNETSVSVLHRFDFKQCEIWFVRFGIDLEHRTLALGNQLGKTYVWDLNIENPAISLCTVLQHPKCITAVRQTTFSRNSNILICVCDDGTIFRWDRT